MEAGFRGGVDGRFSPPGAPRARLSSGAMFHQVVLVLVALVIASCGGGSSDMGPSRGQKPVDLPPITYEAGADLGGDLRYGDPPDASAADVLAADGPPAPPPDAAPLPLDGPPAPPPDVAPALPYAHCPDKILAATVRTCRNGPQGNRLRTAEGLLCAVCESERTGLPLSGCWATPEDLGVVCTGQLYYCAQGCGDPKCRVTEPFDCH